MKHIQARCTDDEYFLFVQAAKYYGVTLSELIKKCIKNNIPADLDRQHIKLPKGERKPKL